MITLSVVLPQRAVAGGVFGEIASIGSFSE